MLKTLKALALAGALTCVGFGSANAADTPPLFFFANLLAAPVQVEIDGKAVLTVDPDMVKSVPLPPGEHVIKVITDDGSSYAKPYQLDAATLAEAKGAKWWCMAVAPRTPGSTSGYVFQFPTDRCQAIVGQVVTG